MIEEQSFDIFLYRKSGQPLVACARRTGFETVDVFVFSADHGEYRYWFVEMPEPEYEAHCFSKDASGQDYFPRYALSSQYMQHVGFSEKGFSSTRQMLESALDGDAADAVLGAIEPLFMLTPVAVRA